MMLRWDCHWGLQSWRGMRWLLMSQSWRQYGPQSSYAKLLDKVDRRCKGKSHSSTRRRSASTWLLVLYIYTRTIYFSLLLLFSLWHDCRRVVKDDSGRQICAFKDIPGRRISAGGQMEDNFFCLPGSLEDKSGRQIFETTLLPRIQREYKKTVCQGFRNNWVVILGLLGAEDDPSACCISVTMVCTRVRYASTAWKSLTLSSCHREDCCWFRWSFSSQWQLECHQVSPYAFPAWVATDWHSLPLAVEIVVVHLLEFSVLPSRLVEIPLENIHLFLPSSSNQPFLWVFLLKRPANALFLQLAA